MCYHAGYMCRHAFWITGITFAVAIVSPVLAATTTPATTTETTLPEQRVTETTVEIAAQQARLEAITTTDSPLSPRTQDRLQNLGANLSNRHEAMIIRLRQIGGRLETRRDILTDQGIDTSSATRALTVAHTSLDNAAASLEQIDQQIYRFIYSPDPAAQWYDVRVIYELSNQSLIDAHTALRIAVNELEQVANSAGS